MADGLHSGTLFARSKTLRDMRHTSKNSPHLTSKASDGSRLSTDYGKLQYLNLNMMF